MALHLPRLIAASLSKDALFVVLVSGVQFGTGGMFSLIPSLAIAFLGKENLSFDIAFLVTSLAVGSFPSLQNEWRMGS